MMNSSQTVAKLLKYDDEYKILYSIENTYPFPFMQLSIAPNQVLTEKSIGRFRKWFLNDKPVTPLTVYEPFYPENFYSWWEILFNYNITDKTVSCIDSGCKYNFYNCSPLGALEAVLKLKELRNSNFTISRVTKNDIIDYHADEKFNRVYIFDTHKLHEIQHTTKGLYLVNNEELPEMEFGCNVIICKNMFDIDDKLIESLSYFKTVSIKKPSCDNKLEPNIFVICENYQEDVQISYNKLYSDIYKYKLDYVDHTHQYMELMINYKENVKNIKSDFNNENVINWIKNNKLLLITDMNPRKFGKKDFKRGPLSMQIYNDKLFKTHDLDEIKITLNQYKRPIDTKVQGRYITEHTNWDTVTNNVDLLHYLKAKLRDDYGYKHVTNAWMKCFEIISSFGLLRKKFSKAFHICESPGAFIVACKKWMTLYHDNGIKSYHWYAQSLNPIRAKYKKRPHVFKDQLGVIRDNRGKWLWGKTKTGDITDWTNIMGYKYDKYLKNITLLTADGGLHMPENMFNEQEAYTGKLIIGEIAAMLNILKKNGSGFVKMYLPFAEPYMISLLYKLTTKFKEVHLFKPLSSHPSSSEIYVVCLYYEELLKDDFNDLLKDKLANWKDDESHKEYLVPKETIPKEFISSLSRASSFLATRQRKSIERSLYYYSNPDQINVKQDQKECEELWLNRYLKNIRPSYKNENKENDTRKIDQQSLTA